MRETVSTGAILSVTDPGVYATDPTPAPVDRAGFDAVSFALTLGIGGVEFSATNRIDVFLEHSDDGVSWDGCVADMTVPNNFPDQNTADPATNMGPGRVMSFNAPHHAVTVHRWAYIGGSYGERRYVRLRPHFVGTHATGTPMSILAMLDESSVDPIGSKVA